MDLPPVYGMFAAASEEFVGSQGLVATVQLLLWRIFRVGRN